MKKLIFSVSFILLFLLSATAVLAQKNLKPVPTPDLKYFDYFVEAIPQEGEESGLRKFKVSLEGRKDKDWAKDEKAQALISKEGFPISAFGKNVIILAYPTDVSDCRVLADANRMATFIMQHFFDDHVLRFNLSILKEAYQTLPDCGTESSATDSQLSRYFNCLIKQRPGLDKFR